MPRGNGKVPRPDSAGVQDTSSDDLAHLLGACQDAVVFVDAAGKIVRFNRAAEAIFGYLAESVLGKPVEMLMPEPYAKEHAGYIAHYERTGEAKAIGRIRRVRARRANGELFPIELSVTEMAPGSRARYGAFIRDVSERERLQQDLLERERLAAIGLGTSVFAHELGNPLNSLALHAQLLHRTLNKELHDAAGRARTITDEIRRLSDLLLEFRRAGRRTALELKPVDVAALVHDVVHTLALPSTPVVNVVTRLEERLPAIHADRDKMKQVLLNLCKNAVEALPDGGTVTVEASCDGQDLCLCVRDTGEGVPDGIDVFKPFQTTKQSGTGLGLAIVRDIVLAHGGSVRVQSKAGEGATFKISLPVEHHSGAGTPSGSTSGTRSE